MAQEGDRAQHSPRPIVRQQPAGNASPGCSGGLLPIVLVRVESKDTVSLVVCSRQRDGSTARMG